MKKDMPGSTLICTLGTSAPVISETLTALIARRIKIAKLIIVHTSDQKVFSNKYGDNPHDIGLNALLKHLKTKYKKLKVQTVNLEKNDILTEDDNNHLLNTILNVFSEEKSKGVKTYLGIAGGRKTMSAISLFAAYLIGCDGIFHIIVNGNESELNKQYGFSIPEQYLTLIDIPNINLSAVLGTVIEDIDKDNKYGNDFFNFLSENSDRVDEVFQRVNNKLKSSLNTKKLKEEYEKKSERYLKLCNVIQSIVQRRVKNLALLTPQIDFRVKSFESIIGKIERRKQDGITINDPFTDFDDIAGIRVTCSFKEDVDVLKKYFNSNKDFTVISYENKFQDFGYTAHHFTIKLKPERTKLIEYQDLEDLKCELQVKTIFAHSWSLLQHRLVYKSTGFNEMTEKQKSKVNAVFTSSAVLLKQTEKVVSQLRKFYKH